MKFGRLSLLGNVKSGRRSACWRREVGIYNDKIW